ncbi:hypothetical protein FS763_01345 [Agrobacterium vitis]|uniref:hypothetical protein n=1 Tax=Allorhizobium ampelinum TaxID=3025782 RepID=UPI001F2BDC91|nr:hypothetical protein [Allorhizobium ampelinum]MCF1470575.1 hypothetical protein [Allorhizobium ampelinum]
MVFRKGVTRPSTPELLAMAEARETPVTMAKAFHCSVDTVRGWLREAGCKPDRKGHWLVPADVADRLIPGLHEAPAIADTIVTQPIIRQHQNGLRSVTIPGHDGSKTSLPALSMFLAARPELMEAHAHG